MCTPTTLRLVITTVLLAFAIGLVGCDSNTRLRGLNNEDDNAANNGSDTGTDQEDDVEDMPMDEHGHGSEEGEQDLIEPGHMNGSWRAATADVNDTPAVHFDTFQDMGDPEITGTYQMGLAIYERLDGETGQIAEGSLSGDQLTIKWNPTNDEEEMFTLTATKVDDDTFEGSVTAQRNPNLDVAVKLTRNDPAPVDGESDAQ